MPRSWIVKLWLMRFAAPAVMLAAIANGAWAYSQGRTTWAAVNAILAAVNLYLTYVEWFVLQPQWPGRRV